MRNKFPALLSDSAAANLVLQPVRGKAPPPTRNRARDPRNQHSVRLHKQMSCADDTSGGGQMAAAIPPRGKGATRQCQRPVRGRDERGELAADKNEYLMDGKGRKKSETNRVEVTNNKRGF